MRKGVKDDVAQVPTCWVTIRNRHWSVGLRSQHLCKSHIKWVLMGWARTWWTFPSVCKPKALRLILRWMTHEWMFFLPVPVHGTSGKVTLLLDSSPLRTKQHDSFSAIVPPQKKRNMFPGCYRWYLPHILRFPAFLSLSGVAIDLFHLDSHLLQVSPFAPRAPLPWALPAKAGSKQDLAAKTGGLKQQELRGYIQSAYNLIGILGLQLLGSTQCKR